MIGGGPAGLTAAIYLARFHLAVTVIDAGHSRAALIPKTRNHAGFPEGIAGTVLVERMREQALRHGAVLVRAEATALERSGPDFRVTAAGERHAASAVLLATGVVNRRPDMDPALHDAALASGALRYCPICDGYEVSDTAVAVIGTGERGCREAEFLRSYTRDVTLIAPDGAHDLADALRGRLSDGGIVLLDGPPRDYALVEGGMRMAFPAGERTFASVYPALGSDIKSGLAAAAGASVTDEGCLTVDTHQRTDVPGLYAAGDVVLGLDQISHAMGEGGVAATTIRNDLAERRPLRR